MYACMQEAVVVQQYKNTWQPSAEGTEFMCMQCRDVCTSGLVSSAAGLQTGLSRMAVHGGPIKQP